MDVTNFILFFRIFGVLIFLTILIHFFLQEYSNFLVKKIFKTYEKHENFYDKFIHFMLSLIIILFIIGFILI